MKNWFNDFEVTIAAGGVAPIRQSGRIVRITDIEGGTEVAAKVDGTGWAKIEAGMSSPDTVEAFQTLYLRNDSAAEITVRGWVSYGRGTDDRKKLLGAVTIDDSDPVRVKREPTREFITRIILNGSYQAIGEGSVAGFDEYYVMYSGDDKCRFMERNTYNKIATLYSGDIVTIAGFGTDFVVAGESGNLYVWGVCNG